LFYLLFPFALIWIVKKTSSNLTAIVLGLFFLNIIFSAIYWNMLPRLFSLSDSSLYKSVVEAIYLHPIFKFTIFLFGCLCGRFYLNSSWMTIIRKYNILILLASLILIIAGCRYIGLEHRYIIDAGILGFLYFPLVLSICSLDGTLLKVLSWKPFLFLGEISYGIYIMQVPVAYYFKHLFTNDKDFNSVGLFLLYTVSLILVCWVLYYLYEVPAKKMIAGRKLRISVGAA
jgi:peptidoglycan/LPS O-acetylase OafA/YrhL